MINITNTYQEVNAHHETDTMVNVQTDIGIKYTSED